MLLTNKQDGGKDSLIYGAMAHGAAFDVLVQAAQEAGYLK